METTTRGIARTGWWTPGGNILLGKAQPQPIFAPDDSPRGGGRKPIPLKNMLASTRHKFAFLCNPKAGSTSIEAAIRPFCDIRLTGHPGVKHLTARAFESHVRPLLRKVDPDRTIKTFCIIREPLDRLASWYRYRRREALADPRHRNSGKYTGGISFSEFIDLYLAGGSPLTAGVGSQAGFVRLKDGSLGVDYIFRFDQMEKVEEFLSKKTQTRIRFDARNQSDSKGRSDPRAGLSDSQLARLKEKLAADYELYHSLER